MHQPIAWTYQCVWVCGLFCHLAQKLHWHWWPENGLLEGIRFCDARAHFWTRLVRKNNYAGAQKWASENPKIGTPGKTTFGHAHTNACPLFFATELPLQLDSNSSPNLLPIISFFNQQGTLNSYGQFSWIVACSTRCINRLHGRINACGSADYSATWHRNCIDIGGLKMDSWRASVFATRVPIFGLAW